MYNCIYNPSTYSKSLPLTQDLKKKCRRKQGWQCLKVLKQGWNTITNTTGIPTLHTHKSLIGMHEMHGRVHPNKCHVTALLVVDLRSSLAYFMMTHPLPIVGKLPIKTLVARQLPTKGCYVYNMVPECYTHTHTL